MTADARVQDLLLQAAVLDGARALDAWRTWRDRGSVDALDRDSQWLLPLLWHNLHAQGVPPVSLGRYGNVYRHNWYKNLLTLRRAEPVLARLDADAVRPVIVGGAAMALQRPDAIGARPFDIVRVLVTSRRASEPVAPPSGAGDVDVRRVLFGAPWDEAMAGRARECRWRQARWLVPEPADHLVAICIRQHEWDRRSTLLWLADAAILVRGLSEAEWRRVAASACVVGQADRVAAALRMVEARCAIALPGTALRSLDAAAREVAS